MILLILQLCPRQVPEKVAAPKKPEVMHIMTVSCGRPNYQGIKDIKKPLDQSLTMIKSAALFAQQRLHIHIFTEEDMAPLFEGKYRPNRAVSLNKSRQTLTKNRGYFLAILH